MKKIQNLPGSAIQYNCKNLGTGVTNTKIQNLLYCLYDLNTVSTWESLRLSEQEFLSGDPATRPRDDSRCRNRRPTKKKKKKRRVYEIHNDKVLETSSLAINATPDEKLVFLKSYAGGNRDFTP